MTSTLRCRPGDLAIIIRDEPGYEENVGRIVEVHGPAHVHIEHGLTWLIVPVTHKPYAVRTRRGKLYDSEITVEDQIEHADAWMMPIRPEVEEDVEDDFTPMSFNPILARQIKDSFIDDWPKAPDQSRDP